MLASFPPLISCSENGGQCLGGGFLGQVAAAPPEPAFARRTWAYQGSKPYPSWSLRWGRSNLHVVQISTRCRKPVICALLARVTQTFWEPAQTRDTSSSTLGNQFKTISLLPAYLLQPHPSARHLQRNSSRLLAHPPRFSLPGRSPQGHAGCSSSSLSACTPSLPRAQTITFEFSTYVLIGSVTLLEPPK